MLLGSGVDLHSYQPTADDIVMISDCDLFVCVGGESDGNHLFYITVQFL